MFIVAKVSLLSFTLML